MTDLTDDKKGSNNNTNESITISTQDYKDMMSKLELLNKEITTLKMTNNASNKKVDDPLKNAITDNEKKAEETKKQEYLTSFYAEVKNSFNNAYGSDAKNYETRLKDVSNLEDKINYMAKAVIRKAFGDSETINNLIDSFKSGVVNSDSAFYAKYQNAVEKLSANKASINSSLLNQRTGDIELKELQKLRSDLIDFRTRNTALAKAKNLGLIA